MIRRASAKHSFDKLRRCSPLKVGRVEQDLRRVQVISGPDYMAIGKTMLGDWSSKQTDQRRAQYRDVDAAFHAQALRRGIEFLTIIRLRRISKPSTRTVRESFDAVQGPFSCSRGDWEH
jgi:hypothetical protein